MPRREKASFPPDRCFVSGSQDVHRHLEITFGSGHPIVLIAQQQPFPLDGMFRLRVDVSDVHLKRSNFHVRTQCSRITNFEFDRFIAEIRFGHVHIEEEHFVEIRLIRSFLNLRLFHFAKDADATDRMQLTSVQLSSLEDFDPNLKILPFRPTRFALPAEGLIVGDLLLPRIVARLL